MKKQHLFHVGKTFHHASLVLNTLIMGCDEQEVINDISTCCIIAISCIISKQCGRVGVAPASPHICRRTQLPPRGWARTEAKEEVLQHPLGMMGLAVSAWPHSSSCYHHEIQEKGCSSMQMSPIIPIPSGHFWLSQNYDVCHHEGPLVTTTVSAKRARNVVVGTRKAIFPPSSVHRAFISWIWTFCGTFIWWEIYRRNCGEFIFHRSKPVGSDKDMLQKLAVDLGQRAHSKSSQEVGFGVPETRGTVY